MSRSIELTCSDLIRVTTGAPKVENSVLDRQRKYRRRKVYRLFHFRPQKDLIPKRCNLVMSYPCTVAAFHLELCIGAKSLKQPTGRHSIEHEAGMLLGESKPPVVHRAEGAVLERYVECYLAHGQLLYLVPHASISGGPSLSLRLDALNRPVHYRASLVCRTRQSLFLLEQCCRARRAGASFSNLEFFLPLSFGDRDTARSSCRQDTCHRNESTRSKFSLTYTTLDRSSQWTCPIFSPCD